MWYDAIMAYKALRIDCAYMRLDPCRPWLRIRQRPISNDFLSARSLSRLHELIGKASCDASDSAKGTYLPTRLIDVKAKKLYKLEAHNLKKMMKRLERKQTRLKRGTWLSAIVGDLKRSLRNS
jgi:hypothetical protein